VGLRLPFMATHHIQEDALISLRCARNLALGFGYGFNVGERVSASTSHAYVFLAALVYAVFREAFIPVLQLLGACSVVAGVYCIASAASDSTSERSLLWVLGSATPIALSISFLGMETPLLILVAGLLILDLRRPLPRFISLPLIGLLPWIRPDAVAIGLIFVACQILRDRRLSLVVVSALIAGVSTLLVFNRVYFGQWLNQSIVAKGVQHGWNHSMGAFADNLSGIFLGLGRSAPATLFSPLNSKYLFPIQPLFSLIGVVVCLWGIRLAWRNSLLRGPIVALLALALLLPIAYAWGNVLFPWYLHPSQLSFVLLALLSLRWAGLQASPSLRPYIALGATALVACLAVGQWALSVNWGRQEYYYRGGIGRYLRSISAKQDTLLLEPAGYIPFYSELYTWDEVGIVSPEVTGFRKRLGTRWWVKFVQAKRPTFLVERSPMLNYTTVDGYPLSSGERAWFDRNYKLVYRASYQPEGVPGHPLLQRIARMGQASDYLVYRLIPESGSSER
jgi:hypothetical protein